MMRLLALKDAVVAGLCVEDRSSDVVTLYPLLNKGESVVVNPRGV